MRETGRLAGFLVFPLRRSLLNAPSFPAALHIVIFRDLAPQVRPRVGQGMCAPRQGEKKGGSRWRGD